MRRSPAWTSAARLGGLAAALVMTAGCTSSTPQAAPTPSDAAAPQPVGTTPPPTCPPSSASRARWPAPIPADLPMPPGVTDLAAPRQASDGVTVLQFSTRASLQTGVVFLLERMRPAGYTLGRGDAETFEADAPFAKGDLQGVFRLVARGDCATDWLLAVARRQRSGGNPLLPPRPGVTPSPLPFG